MAFDYNTKITGIKNLLITHNANGADPYLSDGLEVKINDNNIKIGDPNIEIKRGENYPCIYIKVGSVSEEFADIGQVRGNRNSKFKTVVYDVFFFFAKQGGGTSYSDLLGDVYTLARNIETVFRNDTSLGNAALWSNARSTAFSQADLDAGTYIKAGLIELEGRYLIK